MCLQPTTGLTLPLEVGWLQLGPLISLHLVSCLWQAESPWWWWGSILRSTKAFEPSSEMSFCSYYHILLPLESHKANPDSRGEEIDAIS